ncbi:MAG: hypothetical protein JXN62_14130 [Bacteroidales bacterium]|nr:hypothetical protein [Bacteroidales bacterium]
MEEYLKNVKDSKKYFSVSKYFLFLENEHGIKSPQISERKNLYQRIESECARICDERNIKVEKVLHLALGSINEYPEHVLAQVVFGEESRQYFPLSDTV